MAKQPSDAMMLYGLAPVHEALQAGRRRLHRLFLREGKPSPAQAELAKLARARGVPIETRTVHELGNLGGTRHHQGALLACGPLPALDFTQLLDGEPQLLVALDQIEDPQNLGSIARSARFFGADALLVLRHRSAPLSPAASKASAGALEQLPVCHVSNLAQALQQAQQRGLTVLGADGGGAELRDVAPPPRCALVLGAEGSGLRELTRKRCETLLRIGGDGFESLNVGVAAGILLHWLRGNADFRRAAPKG